jgi:chromosome segregation ATPase
MLGWLFWVAKWRVIMSFMDMIKRDNSRDEGGADAAFEGLDEQMAEALDESMAAEGRTEPIGDVAQAQEPQVQAKADESPALPDPAAAPQSVVAAEKRESGRRLTAHTQSRLAALGSFEKLYRDMQTRLQEIDAKLSEVTTSQQLTRRFFNVLQSDVHRANELEVSNTGLAAEQKKLTEQLADATKRLQERESLIEGHKQREAHLAQDNEALRAALADAKLQLVEAGNLQTENEDKLGEAVKALSAQTLDAERSARENEVLREKQVNLSLDLDKALKREAELQRKLGEVTAIHKKEAAQHSELLVALSKSEKEALRLQMALESAQMKQQEMAEAALIAETDREAEAKRNTAEVRGLRAEVQTLQAKLDAAVTERSEATAEIADLKARLNDAMAQKQVADEKLAELQKENESVQQDLSMASANISQLALQQETEQIKLDIHRQECEDLRAEIAVLNARIKDLLPFERLYKVTAAREGRVSNGSAELVPVTVAKSRNAGKRPVAANRSTAA